MNFLFLSLFELNWTLISGWLFSLLNFYPGSLCVGSNTKRAVLCVFKCVRACQSASERAPVCVRVTDEQRSWSGKCSIGALPRASLVVCKKRPKRTPAGSRRCGFSQLDSAQEFGFFSLLDLQDAPPLETRLCATRRQVDLFDKFSWRFILIFDTSVFEHHAQAPWF